jgi:serine/threonine protein kinase
VKVVDFGIAKMLGENSEGNSDELTLTGSFVGTPIYMSPERFNRQPFDGRADVYSVAVLAFEMLCGRPPFVVGAAGPFALIMDHLQSPPPLLRAFHPDLPGEIEEIVQKGLSKDPDERPSASMFGNGFWLAARQYVSVDEPGLGPTDGGGFEDVPTASGLKTPPIITLDTDSRRISRQTGSWKDDSISSGFFSDDPAEK